MAQEVGGSPSLQSIQSLRNAMLEDVELSIDGPPGMVNDKVDGGSDQNDEPIFSSGDMLAKNGSYLGDDDGDQKGFDNDELSYSSGDMSAKEGTSLGDVNGDHKGFDNDEPPFSSGDMSANDGSSLGDNDGDHKGFDNDELPYSSGDMSAKDGSALGDDDGDHKGFNIDKPPYSHEDMLVKEGTFLGDVNGDHKGFDNDKPPYSHENMLVKEGTFLGDVYGDHKGFDNDKPPYSHEDMLVKEGTFLGDVNGDHKGFDNDELPYSYGDMPAKEGTYLGDENGDHKGFDNDELPYSPEDMSANEGTSLDDVDGDHKGFDNDEPRYSHEDMSAKEGTSLGDHKGFNNNEPQYSHEDMSVKEGTSLGDDGDHKGYGNDEPPYSHEDMSAMEGTSLGDETGDHKGFDNDEPSYSHEDMLVKEGTSLGDANGDHKRPDNVEPPYASEDMPVKIGSSLGDDDNGEHKYSDDESPFSSEDMPAKDGTSLHEYDGDHDKGSDNDDSSYFSEDMRVKVWASLGDDDDDGDHKGSDNDNSPYSSVGDDDGDHKGSDAYESPYSSEDMLTQDGTSLGDDGDHKVTENYESSTHSEYMPDKDVTSLGDGEGGRKGSDTSMPSSKTLYADFRWSDTTPDASKTKLCGWYQLPDGNWELATIIRTSGNESLISFAEGKVMKVSTDKLLPSNPDILDGVDDLMQLSYLNEPSVLYNLEYRYHRDMIYTKAGPVLVAINPLKNVPLYGNDYIEAYKRKSMDSPHVYGVTDIALREMIRDEVNQSIIISGESGAGKTETAKIAMQYLAALGGGSGIEYEILKTNPILEAFGNAKTLRNDNSSRFGKLIEIHFSETGKISGANIQTFLLEKSRVVQCSEGERSYHIFYQLCAGAPPALREKLQLKNVVDYNYLKQSNCYTIAADDDAGEFCTVMEALNVVHIDMEDQDSVFAMLAAVLSLGNVTFSVVDGENHVEPEVDEALLNAATLLGCKVEALTLALSTRKMKVGKRNDTIVQKLTLPQAIDARDALSKSIYACLFDWLVEQINKSLAVGKKRTGRSISILDIYGFESFERNSFEQFCINYANERLQQHFNRHLFKLEQEEYIQDGIDWAKVDFEDNQDCLNLFEKKPLGLQSLLDEESTFPNGTDLSFAEKLRQHLHFNPCFRGERGKAFTVRHYAGEVTYDTTAFLEKNRDLLHADSIVLLSSCTCHLPQSFASALLAQSEKPVVGALHKSGGADSQKLSVMTKFKGQLFQLMQRLANTTSHFIRCIKPNNYQTPGIYNQGLILQQLQCCGVIEVVRISRAGFPTRMVHRKFAKRYGFLLLEHVASQDPLSVSVAILNQFNILPEMYQVGYTKLFFRTGQIGMLEDTRNRTLHGILRVQSCFRGHKARCQVKALKGAIAFVQSYIRAEKTRKEYAILVKDHRAAITIQKHVKGRKVRHVFNRLSAASSVIQAVIRGWLVRRCSDDVALLQFLRQSIGPEEVLVKSSFLADMQLRILRTEAALHEKEQENEMLLQRMHQYENRWSEYELKMKSMEELWQKQMRSLQSNLSIAKKSMSFDDSQRSLDALANGNDESESSSDPESHIRRHESFGRRSSTAGLSVIHRLAEEFEQRSQVFGDDARFLVEVKSGQTEANLDPDQELRRLKQMFEAWKKDFGARLRETKVILNKLGNEEMSTEKIRKKWWGRRNSSRMN